MQISTFQIDFGKDSCVKTLYKFTTLFWCKKHLELQAVINISKPVWGSLSPTAPLCLDSLHVDSLEFGAKVLPLQWI